MRPTTRIPTVEFRSLLLPSIRIPVRAIQALHRPQRAPVPHVARHPQCLAQRRFLNLYKTARAKTVLGQHKVLNFTQYNVAPPGDTDYRINLYGSDKKDNKRTLIAENISLQEVYDNHIKDGRMLFLTQELKKNTAKDLMKLPEEDIPGEFKDYALMDAHTHNVPMTNRQKGSQFGELKTIIFSLSSPVSHHKILLDRAYQFIEGGSPVECRTRMPGKKLTKEERIQPGDPGVWPWMHEHFPHLRPDFIMRAMPEGTIFLVVPVSDGRRVQWVMSRPAKQMAPVDLTERLLRVKESVKQSIREGNQSQLPKVMRKKLAESGQGDYSVNTGLPRTQARHKYARGGKVTYGAEETKYRERDAKTEGFMLPAPGFDQRHQPRIEKSERETSEFARTELRSRAPWKIKRGSFGKSG